MSKLQVTGNNEINQSLIRLIIVLFIFFYIHIIGFLLDQEISQKELRLLSFFILIASIELLWAITFLKDSLVSIQNTVFRISTNLIDNAFLAIALIQFTYIGMPLAFVYLWITFGIGLRYGRNYLMLSAILNIISFTIVLYYSEAWHTKTSYLLAAGFLISFLILPAYVYILILRLSEALESEKKANMVKESFLENINHKLRTPVASIVSMVEVMMLENKSKNMTDQLNMIKASASMSLDLINSILNASKLKANNYKIVKKDFKLNEAVCDVCNIVMPQAINKKLTLYQYFDINCYGSYFGPLEQIKHVLINLLSNAIKFTEHGYVSLSVEMIQKSKNKHELLFSIVDTGVGIPNEYKSEILRPYKQILDDNDKNIGSGLGTAIANDLANIVGGEISFKSTAGMGSEFNFRVNTCQTEQNSHDSLLLIKCPIVVFVMSKTPTNLYSYCKNSGLDFKYCSTWSEVEEYYISYGEIIVLIDGVSYNHISLMHKKYNYKELQLIFIADDLYDFDRNRYLGVTTVIDKNTDAMTIHNAINLCNSFLFSKQKIIKNNSKLHKSLNILVVEDDYLQSQVYKSMMSAYAKNYEIVSSGSSALESISKCSWDVIMLDLYLPDIDGIDLAEQIIDFHQTNLPIILLITAEKLRDPPMLRQKEIFDDIILKPCKFDELIHKIEDNYLSVSREINLMNGDVALNEYINLEKIGDIINICGHSKFNELRQTYECEMYEDLNNMKIKITKQDHNAIKSILHRMKGASSQIGATNYYKAVCSYLEKVNIKTTSDELDSMHGCLFMVHKKTISYFNELGAS